MPIAFQRGKQPNHFVLGQVLADPIGRVRLAPSRCDWSHFSGKERCRAARDSLEPCSIARLPAVKPPSLANNSSRLRLSILAFRSPETRTAAS
jgi:hypothetical protein